MSRFNARLDNRTTNLAGGRAIRMHKEEELLHSVLTTFLEDKFYESGNTRLERIKQLVKECDPIFVAKLAIVARTEFHMRSVSHVLISELSLNHRGDDLVRKTLEKVIIRVDDITEIVSYLDCKLPKQVKRGIRRALLKFDRYQLAKYRGENKSVKLVDVFNLVHPKAQFASDEQKEAWEDLINDRLISFDTWETEISTTKDKKAAWSSLVLENKLGYMALLRNLNNLIKNDVNEHVMHTAIAKLTDRQQVKKSKQLPFRFLTAYKNVQGNRKLADAISLAMDISVDNTPELPGKTLIAIDCSGSMQGDPMSKASIFGATLAKANKDADVILFDTSLYEMALSSRVPVVDLAQKIEESARGGGTETSLVFSYAHHKNKKYDRFIIISDNESWQEGYNNSSVQAVYNEYKKQTNTDPFVYAIDIAGYGTKDISSNRVYHLAGWSNNLLNFIGRVEQGDSLLKYIKSVEI